jgi:hypothetical protein
MGELSVKRALFSVVLTSAMVVASLPAISAASGPLAPGSAAGVKQAQALEASPLLIAVGIGAVIALGVIALSNSGDDDAAPTTPPTTTTTTTTAATTTTTTNP